MLLYIFLQYFCNFLLLFFFLLLKLWSQMETYRYKWECTNKKVFLSSGDFFILCFACSRYVSCKHKYSFIVVSVYTWSLLSNTFHFINLTHTHEALILTSNCWLERLQQHFLMAMLCGAIGWNDMDEVNYCWVCHYVSVR